MKQLWEYLLKVQQEQIPTQSIRFAYAKTHSPYLELAQEDINSEEAEAGQVMDINPYFRFSTVFQELCHPDYIEYEEIRAGLFHLMIHFLGEYDLKQGMSKREYYKKFICRDIDEGRYGQEMKQHMNLFSSEEQKIIAEGLLKQYSAGNSLELLKEMLRAMFVHSIVYDKAGGRNEILIYIGRKETAELDHKVQLLIHLFAGIQYRLETYYQFPFVIFEEKQTCILGETALY